MNSPPTIISACSVLLRRATLEDADSIYKIASHAEVMRFMNWPTPTDVCSVKAHLEGIPAMWESGEEFQWSILERVGSEVIGSISVRIKGHVADFGYFLERSSWGKQAAFDAASALMNWLETQPEILRVCATVDVENTRSRRLLERLGLELEGVMRGATFRPNIGGRPRDTASYACIKE